MRKEHLARDAAETVVLDACGAAWDRLHERIAHRFGRVEVRARVRHYLAGLLARVERKNGWQLAEAIGERGPQGVQRLLRTASWDAEKVRDDLRAYVIEHLGDPASGVLIIDETSFPKKGTHSCGVTPQYCGTLGQTANAPLGVFLAYGSCHGTAFIDRALYLPRAWTQDRARCSAAGVPLAVGFATKVALAKQVLAHAFTAAVPARWVVADSFYGRAHHFRQWLQGQDRAHVQRAQAVATSLPAAAWVPRSAGLGSQGARVHAWACVALTEAAPRGMGHWLLVRQALNAPEQTAYYRAYGPADTQADELVRVAGMRWSIEEGFAQAKGEVGLDQYEVRRWDAWYRHITLCLLAHAYLVVVRTQARDAAGGEQEKDEPPPGSLVALTVPEVRRLVQARAAAAAQREFLLGWSRWRRAHQAGANRCHCARRLRARAVRLPPAPRPVADGQQVSDTVWAQLCLLLPPQQPVVGRPRHDHRTILSGILWVLRTASPWREMPVEFGKWDTAYARYRVWRSEGRWQRLIDALGPDAPVTSPPYQERQ